MKRTRKGFTLVELLIVVAIVGALAATMMVSSGSSITKAKATAIANNLRVCTSGAQLYYLQHADDESGTGISVDCKTMLTSAVPNFKDFGDGSIKYESSDATGSVPDKWIVTVKLTGTDSADILTQLKAIKGFGGLGGTKDVKYTVFTGEVADSD